MNNNLTYNTYKQNPELQRVYGNFRNYRKFLRKKGDYKNPSEQEFKKLCDSKEINYIRRGYPDFIILRDGEIYGFVEVKPSNASYLRPTQLRFANFCKKHNIPFAKWSPGEEFPEWF